MTQNGPFKYESSASKLICYFSDQKAGKTCSIPTSSWPKDWKIHVLDIDGGFELAKQLWNQQHDPQNLTIQPVRSYGDLHAGLWSPPPGHNIYFLDTYSSAMKKFKVHVSHPKPDVDEHGVMTLPITDWWKIGGKISGLAVDYFERWSQMVGSYGAWGVVICQEKSEGDPPRLVPDLIGQARKDVASTCNFVLHLEKARKAVGGVMAWERTIRTVEIPQCMAGDRSGALDDFEPVDLAAIIRKVEAKRGNAPTPS